MSLLRERLCRELLVGRAHLLVPFRERQGGDVCLSFPLQVEGSSICASSSASESRVACSMPWLSLEQTTAIEILKVLCMNVLRF